MEQLKCPSCGAIISENDRKGNQFICSYCQTVLLAENRIDTQDEAYASPKMIVPDLCFMDSEQYVEKLNPFFENVCNWQKENHSVDALERCMLEMLKNKDETATKDWKPEHYAKIKEKINLVTGEELIMFKTAALLGFNKLKTGMFLTNKRIGYTDRSKLYDVTYEEVKHILVTSESTNVVWMFPDSQEKIFLSGYGVSLDEQALILAYMISKIYETQNEKVEIIIKDGFYK